MTDRLIGDYRVVRSLEPEHPRCSFSHEALLVTRGERSAVVKCFALPFRFTGAILDDFVSIVRRLSGGARGGNVVPVIDFGIIEGPEPTPWYAMEVAAGESLHGAIERGQRFTAREVRSFAEAAVVASDAAAEHGLLLGLNPRHAMLGGDTARFWDVGLEQWFLRGSATSTLSGWTMRHEGMTLERLRGSPPSGVGEAQSLALLAFVMLSGRWYWDEERDRSAGLMALAKEVLAGPVEPPSARSPVPLPPRFDDGFARCLSGEARSIAEALELLALE